VNEGDFLLALRKVKRTGESARQFQAKELLRGREDRANAAADMSRARNGNVGANGGEAGRGTGHLASVDMHQLMAMVAAAASWMKVAERTDGANCNYQEEANDDTPPEMFFDTDT